jgi:DNA-binding transcriptional ArsR family regulator
VTAAPPPTAGSGDHQPLSPLIHGRARLLILSYLVRAKTPVPFTELRLELQLTDGTLSVHLSRLQEGGLVSVQKRFVGRKPQTLVQMTREGQRRFERYVKELCEIVPGVAP